MPKYVVQIEILALLEGIKHPSCLGIKILDIEGDNLIAIDALKGIRKLRVKFHQS